MQLSVIVVAYNMDRELPRTLFTLSTRCQRDVDASAYEVIVVDNGSRQPVSAAALSEIGGNLTVYRPDIVSHSPAAALNSAVEQAKGDIIVSMIDGARMVSPRCIHWTLKAFELFGRCVTTTPAWHLGPSTQQVSVANGYNQAVEDALLASTDWKADAYRLFDLCAALDPSCSGSGWFNVMAETNVLGLHRDDFNRLGGFDTAFSSRGGGAVNLDLFGRACRHLGRPIVSLLGEGNFHQYHGGVTTNARQGEPSWVEIHDEYRRIRQEDFAYPRYTPFQIGQLNEPARAWFDRASATPAAAPRSRHRFSGLFERAGKLVHKRG